MPTKKNPLISFEVDSLSNFITTDFSFTLASQQIVCLSGPSGSGKTTLLRSLVNLEKTQGEIRINNEIVKPSDLGEKIGIVFQSFNLFPHLNVLENCTLPLILHKYQKNEAQLIANYYLKRLGLSEHIYKFPSQLSGGQQQRVALARCLVLNPQLILLDEPTSALDQLLVDVVIELIKEQAQLGKAILLVSHDSKVVERMQARIIKLNKNFRNQNLLN